jgi:hypothetical protein
LNPALTERQRELIAQWLIDPRGLGRHEWPETLAAFDVLRGSQVVWHGRRMSFTAFYDECVGEPYAAPLLTELLALAAPETEGPSVLARHERLVRAATRQRLMDVAETERRYLLAHCLYWWQAFAKGYLYEVTIRQDLQAAGIEFEAHDLLNRQERLRGYDLTVLGWRGDIRRSSYFLHVARAERMAHDFYITRLFSVRQGVVRDVVLLRSEFWVALDGETQPATIDQVVDTLPAPARVQIRGKSWIAVAYETWKLKVKARQPKPTET